jgi:hypothetical protein
MNIYKNDYESEEAVNQALQDAEAEQAAWDGEGDAPSFSYQVTMIRAGTPWEFKNETSHEESARLHQEELDSFVSIRLAAESTPSFNYAQYRKEEYPPMEDYLDAIVKEDTVAQQKYITDCLAVKSKYPKG